MWNGGPRNSLPGHHLREVSRVAYLMEQIPELILFPGAENRFTDFIAN